MRGEKGGRHDKWWSCRCKAREWVDLTGDALYHMVLALYGCRVCASRPNWCTHTGREECERWKGLFPGSRRRFSRKQKKVQGRSLFTAVVRT